MGGRGLAVTLVWVLFAIGVAGCAAPSDAEENAEPVTPDVQDGGQEPSRASPEEGAEQTATPRAFVPTTFTEERHHLELSCEVALGDGGAWFCPTGTAAPFASPRNFRIDLEEHPDLSAVVLEMVMTHGDAGEMVVRSYEPPGPGETTSNADARFHGAWPAEPATRQVLLTGVARPSDDGLTPPRQVEVTLTGLYPDRPGPLADRSYRVGASYDLQADVVMTLVTGPVPEDLDAYCTITCT